MTTSWTWEPVHTKVTVPLLPRCTKLPPFALYAAPLTEPSGNVFRGRGLCVRESSCGLVEIGELGCHDLAAALAAAIIVPNKFR